MSTRIQDLPRPLCFVLGGGASSAAAQVGMLRALAEAGVRPDLIVGTSAGALNGALLADDPDGAVARLLRLWLSFKRRQLIPDSPVRRIRSLAGRRQLYSGEGLARLLEQHLCARAFSELEVPFACVATDLDRGSPVTLAEGPLLSALQASCAIPGVFPMVERDGLQLSDGLCVANLPVRQAVELGAASLVVLHGRTDAMPPRGARDVRDVVAAAFAASLGQQTRAELERAAERVSVVVMPGQPQNPRPAFEFSDASRLIDAAYRQSQRLLAAGPLATPADQPTVR